MEKTMCKNCQEVYEKSVEKALFEEDWLDGGFIECGDCWSISTGKA